MGKAVNIALVALLSVALAGCGTTTSSTDQQGSSNQDAEVQESDGQSEESAIPAKDAIKIDEIDYEVASGVNEGRRRVMFSYTNNSPYPIVSVELSLVTKEEATTEEIEDAFDYLLEQGVTEDDIREGQMTCESTFLVEPGEKSSDGTVLFGIYYVNNIEQYEAMTPDIMTIKYLYNGLIYEEYYDCISGTYSLSSDVVDPNQWGSGELSEAIPRPEGMMVVDTRDGETQFSFDIEGMRPEDFNDYVDACRDAGYTEDVAETDTTYYADNADGTYHIDLFYYSESGRLNGYVSYISSEEE